MKKKIELPAHMISYAGNNLADAIVSAEKLLNQKIPDAIFATTDLLAVAVLKTARKMNIQIPGDLGLIGFDGTSTSDYLDLTTVDQALEESGRLAVELLMKRINNSAGPVQTIFLPLTIIERDTTEKLFQP